MKNLSLSKRLLPFSLSALLFLLSGCGSDLMDTGHLDVELLGDGNIQVEGNEINCPDTCKQEVKFTQLEISSHLTSTRRVSLSAEISTDSTFLGWLVDDDFSTDYAETCQNDLSCELLFKSSCGVGHYIPLGCAANGINSIQLRPVTLLSSSLIDWDRASDTLCVLMEPGQAQCWESSPIQYRQFEQTPPPQLINPTQISATRDHACVLDQTGVQCWSDDMSDMATQPNVLFGFSNVESVVVNGGYYGCVLADGDLTCWRRQTLENAPEVSSPENLRRNDGVSLCVDDGPETVCWSTRYNAYEEWREPRS